MKTVTSFVCQECGYDTPKYLGKCPECGEWNSLREFESPKSKVKSQNYSAKVKSVEPKTLSEITSSEKDRLLTGFSELDGVLGGGIVRGSVILLAGDPGIGKSTLLLQLGIILALKGEKVLYISAEESASQVKLRAQRIIGNKKTASNFFVLAVTDTNAAVVMIEETKPNLVIVDSIQTMESEEAGGLSGSMSQVRFATSMFIKSAKTHGIPTILVGHVTKEGMVAGPMVLSHMVDCVLLFEGEKTTNTRILRSLKNRFGSVDEVGIFAMEEQGIAQVQNPEHVFLSDKRVHAVGSVLTSTLEGSRAFLIELQALVVFSRLPMPRRIALGIDVRRLELLLAVLQKHCRLPVDTSDVFVNMAGGLRVSDRAVDLGICLSIFSSLKNIPLGNTVAIAEVGLLGELRPVINLEKRMKEAKKLGFQNIITAKTHSRLEDVLSRVKRT